MKQRSKYLLVLIYFVWTSKNISAQQNALQFRSNSTTVDYVQSPHNAILPFHQTNNTFSIDLWVRFTSTGLRNFISKGVVGVTNGTRFVFGINTAHQLFVLFNDGTTSVTINSGNTYSTLRNGNWQHIGVVVNRTDLTVKFYVNGVVDLVTSTTGINMGVGGTTDGVIIGRSPTSGTGEFAGTIDEVRIWTTDKSSSYTDATFRNNEVSSSSTDLVLYYTFNQGNAGGTNPSSTIIEDQTSNNLDGTFINFLGTGTSSNIIEDTKSIPTIGSTSQVCSQTLTASWTAPSFNYTNTSDYLVDLSTNSTFSSFVSQNLSSSGQTSLKLTNLTNGTLYYVRVKAKNTSNLTSGNSSTLTETPNVCTKTWTGSSSTSYALGSNWSSSSAPEPYDNIIIPASSNIPLLSGNVYVGNIEFTGTAPRIKLSSNSGDTLTISGVISGSSDGCFEGNANARLVFTNTTAGNTLRMYNPTTVSTENQLNQLTISTSGQTLTLGNTLKIVSALQINGGSTLATGGNLTLLSSASGTARIGQMGSGATISGIVKSTVFVPSGLRGFRFLGHPFSSAIGAGQLKTGIILTGNGGQTNGFDSSFLNNPSAFLYNNSTGNSSTSPDPGWEAITNGNAQTLNWPVGAGLRVLVRGDRDQGLTGATPNASTITLEGTVNDGTNVTTLLSNSGSSVYNLVANPYCSNVDLNLCATSNVSSTVYIWDLSLGSKGAYQALSYVSSGNCIIAPYTSFFMVNTNSTKGTNNASITFSENAKVSQSNSGGRVLKGASQKIVLSLLGDSTLIWDRLELIMDPRFNAALEPEDGIKIINPEVSLYSILGSGEKLAIDYRNNERQVIQLGIDGLVAGKYAFDFSKSSIPTGASYFLIDGDKRIKIETSLKYAFTLTTQELNEAKFRFKIEIESATNGNAEISKNLGLTIFPNPANKLLTIKIDEKLQGDLSAKLLQLDGQILSESFWPSSSNTFEIPTHELPNGLYLLIVEGANGRKIEKVLISHTN